MTVFTKAMNYLGDLDDSFYDDERARDVWNEASAVGFQLAIWFALAAAAVLPWLPGTGGSWVALGILVVTGVVSTAVVAYARSLHVDSAASLRLRPRLVVLLLGYCTAIAGLAVELDAHADSGFWSGFAKGALIGIVAAGIGLVARAVVRKDR